MSITVRMKEEQYVYNFKITVTTKVVVIRRYILNCDNLPSVYYNHACDNLLFSILNFPI